MRDFYSLDSLNYEKYVKDNENQLVNSNTFLMPQTNSAIKITLTNVEIDTLKECGNLTVLRHGDVPIEITLADDKEEKAKKYVKE